MPFYDVVLRWHDGGVINLPSVRASSHEDAEEASLQRYMSFSAKNRKEIEEGGGFQVDAQLISD